jgi:hypothetical protein
LATAAVVANNTGNPLAGLLPMIGAARPVKTPKVGKAMEQPIAPTYRVGLGRKA